MKRFLFLLSIVQFIWLLTCCSNENSPAPGAPTTPTTRDTICFESNIQPLLRFNCATAGCHNASTASQGVVMENFATISAQTTANDLDKSPLYQAIKSGAHQGVRFDKDQLALIQNWILQGAQNTVNCSGITFVCDTNNFTYSKDVKIILDKECVGCHNSVNANRNVILDSYDEVSKVAKSGALVGAIDWLQGFRPMPEGRDQLSDCERKVIRKWIENGMPNN